MEFFKLFKYFWISFITSKLFILFSNWVIIKFGHQEMKFKYVNRQLSIALWTIENLYNNNIDIKILKYNLLFYGLCRSFPQCAFFTVNWWKLAFPLYRSYHFHFLSHFGVSCCCTLYNHRMRSALRSQLSALPCSRHFSAFILFTHTNAKTCTRSSTHWEAPQVKADTHTHTAKSWERLPHIVVASVVAL